MPIFETIGGELSEDYELACYIVSKCYLISEEKTYFENGKYKTYYQVVFPFERDLNDVWLKQEPTFNSEGVCTNSILIDQISGNMDLMISIKKSKNYDLLNRKSMGIHYDEHFKENFEKMKEEFKAKLDYYEQLEHETRSMRSYLDSQINSVDLKNHTKTILLMDQEPCILEKEMSSKVKIKKP